MAERALDTPLRVLLLWLALVVVWQTTGVLSIALGGTAPGPTASLAQVAIAIAVGAGLVVGWRHSPLLFGALAALCGFAAGFAIYRALTFQADFWPSEVNRYLGITINAIGTGGGILALWALARVKGEGDS